MFSEGFVARINLEMNGLEVSGSVNRSSFHSHFEPMRSGLDPGTGQTCGHIEGDVIAIKTSGTFLCFTQKHQTQHLPQSFGHKATLLAGRGPGGKGGEKTEMEGERRNRGYG